MAIPTYTYLIKESIIKNYLGSNLVIALINNSNLGITDTPTAQELEARRNLTMTDIFNTEIGGTSLNGYARAIILNNTITTTVVNGELTESELTVSFTASGGDMEAFSHIVAIRGANVTGADPILNGNNRGDTNGSIIFVEPVDNLSNPGNPLVVLNGATFGYTFKLISSSELV